jgi:hypothetical protein
MRSNTLYSTIEPRSKYRFVGMLLYIEFKGLNVRLMGVARLLGRGNHGVVRKFETQVYSINNNCLFQTGKRILVQSLKKGLIAPRIVILEYHVPSLL